LFLFVVVVFLVFLVFLVLVELWVLVVDCVPLDGVFCCHSGNNSRLSVGMGSVSKSSLLAVTGIVVVPVFKFGASSGDLPPWRSQYWCGWVPSINGRVTSPLLHAAVLSCPDLAQTVTSIIPDDGLTKLLRGSPL
jgi:hypothetical protein